MTPNTCANYKLYGQIQSILKMKYLVESLSQRACSLIYNPDQSIQMNVLIIIISSSLFSFLGYSQNREGLDSIKSFTWTNSLAYLPSVYRESETYKYKNGRIRHTYSKTRVFWRLRWNSKKLLIATNKSKVLDSFEKIMNASEQKKFKLGLSKQDKDSLIAMSKLKDFLGQPLYRVDSNDLKKYIENKDTIVIDTKEFNTAYSKTMDSRFGVIDGVPFSINLEIVTKANDTLKYVYLGNLFDNRVKDTSVDEFLIYDGIYKEYELFRYTPMAEYFYKKKIYSVILTYIAYRENKIDRDKVIPY